MFMLVAEYPDGTRGNSCFCCYANRRTDVFRQEGERLVDLGQTIDFEGHAVLCESCAKEICELLGWKTDQVNAQMQEMREIIGRQQQELAGYKDLQNQINRLANA